jgi:hypothetical protein
MSSFLPPLLRETKKKKKFTDLGISDERHTPRFRRHILCNTEFLCLGTNRTYIRHGILKFFRCGVKRGAVLQTKWPLLLWHLWRCWVTTSTTGRADGVHVEAWPSKKRRRIIVGMCHILERSERLRLRPAGRTTARGARG